MVWTNHQKRKPKLIVTPERVELLEGVNETLREANKRMASELYHFRDAFENAMTLLTQAELRAQLYRNGMEHAFNLLRTMSSLDDAVREEQANKTLHESLWRDLQRINATRNQAGAQANSQGNPQE